MVVVALSVIACAAAVGTWMVDLRRSRLRNRRGSCAGCGRTWAESGVQDVHLIHGQMICRDCAEKAKRRMPWELAALGGWGAFVAGAALTSMAASAPVFGLVVAGAAVGVPWGVVRLMKRANRRQQRALGTGDSPSPEALGPGTVHSAN